MIDDKRVVAWTPFGREATVSILARYMARDHDAGVVDEWILYMNLDEDKQAADRMYGEQLAAEHDWIRILERPQRHPGPKQRSTGYAYRSFVDPDTVYVRFDDDVVYVHDGTVETLVRKKIEMGDSKAIFPIIWNNALVSWYLQQCGIVPREWGEVSPYCMDPVGWANGPFAVKLHTLLLEHIAAGTVESLYMYQDFPIKLGDQFSVSCFASAGADYAALDTPGVLVPDEEEHFHTVHWPRVTGQPNILAGNALVSHWSFFPQRPFLQDSGLLDRYRDLATKAVA
ncbi:hypothetical protein [Streptomyces sp. NPDC006784]|uniref:hypothetical protein n=1 Tax=Streptomyces sp. NPDC006784 TaxID=3364764 RepID=UPI0036B573DB